MQVVVLYAFCICYSLLYTSLFRTDQLYFVLSYSSVFNIFLTTPNSVN